MTKIAFTPLADRLLIEPIEKKDVTTKAGIYLPDVSREVSQEGHVLALGTGRLRDDGTLVPWSVAVGDKVLMSKYCGTEIELDGRKCRIMQIGDILGIIG